MAIALSGSYTSVAGNESTETISFTVPTGSNRYMLVGVGTGLSSPGITSLAYNGDALTLVKDSGLSPNSQCRAYQYGLVAPDEGTFNLVVTFSGSTNNRENIMIGTYTGVDQSTPIGTAVSAVFDSTDPTVNASSAAGELVVDCMSVRDGAATPVVGADQTERANLINDNGNGWTAVSEQAGAGTVTMSWTGSAGFDSAICAVPLKPATSVTLEQEGFRWINDDGSESASTFAASQDTGITAAAGSTRRLRVLVNATGDPATYQYKLQWRKSGGSWADVT